jgi:hypothetical protein
MLDEKQKEEKEEKLYSLIRMYSNASIPENNYLSEDEFTLFVFS